MKTPFVIGVALLWASIVWYLVKFLHNRWNLRRMLPILLEPYVFAMVPPEYKHLYKDGAQPSEDDLQSIGKIHKVDTANPKHRGMSIELIESFLREGTPFTATFTQSNGATVSVEVFYDKAYVSAPGATKLDYKIYGEAKIENELARRIAYSVGAILLDTKFSYI